MLTTALIVSYLCIGSGFLGWMVSQQTNKYASLDGPVFFACIWPFVLLVAGIVYISDKGSVGLVGKSLRTLGRSITFLLNRTVFLPFMIGKRLGSKETTQLPKATAIPKTHLDRLV